MRRWADIRRGRVKSRVKASVWADQLVAHLSEVERWALKQALAGPGRRYYGDGGTIHSTGVLNVEVTLEGRVVSVWFRCQMLPYMVHVVTASRAASMDSVKELPAISGVELVGG